MRKRILPILISIVLIIFVFPSQVSATGGFVTIKGTTLYHSPFCDLVVDCCIEDLEWFETQAMALQAGYTACEQCDASSGYSYVSDGDTYWNSSDTKIQNALEIERLFGILEGYDAGKEYGYEEGYEDGENHGYDSGYDDGRDAGKESAHEELEAEYRQSLEDVKSDAYFTALIVAALIGIPAFALLSSNRVRKETEQLKKTHDAEIEKHCQTIRCLESNLNSHPSFSASSTVQRTIGVTRFGYKDGGLYVELTDGKVNMYYYVKENIYQEMRNATSINDFFHDRINGLYPYIPMK